MQFPQIRLQSQNAQIQINQTRAQQTIRQPQAVQSITQPKGELSINTSPSRLSIDQTEAWADMGIKHVSRMTDEAAQKGKQAVHQATARIVRQGVELMKIEQAGNPIARQAKENSQDAPKQFNIGWIPSAGSVKIEYKPSDVNINYTARKPTIDTRAQKPVTSYQPGTVDVSLKQKNHLDIDFANLKHYGINFEMNI
ncbi:DUF6470 family protein [Aquibacillus rhizosphaerae]|uniref:DUF6470 family protein n=1 Tax=Aquibacillus rhizosphaerae TaxID=3051431 RepID=A0ABT7L0B8_9BACI|nr:DUF6470 family protein [Aquibacillus sp. LR5S19]MDL4839220.1 DUF6470 family protein [Aquibacillus sp. LR5S19]